MFQILSFLKEWSPLAAWVAVVALIVNYIIMIYKSYYVKSKLEIYETGFIEVGYSQFGPTIGLLGTIRALHKDCFIPAIRLRVNKNKDSSIHDFVWFVFRAPVIPLFEDKSVPHEPASSFMLIINQPHKYSIVFRDITRGNEMFPFMKQARDAITTILSDAPLLSDINTRKLLSEQDRQRYISDIYVKYEKDQVYLDTNQKLDRLFYWEAGQYTLTIEVDIERKKGVFMREWEIEISDEDEKNLRLNTISIMRDICYQSDVTYNFAYPAYKEKK